MPDFCLKIISCSTVGASTVECSQTSHPLLIELRTFNTVAGSAFFHHRSNSPIPPDCIFQQRQRERERRGRGIRQPVSKYQNRPAKTEQGNTRTDRTLTFFPRSARIFSRSLKLYDHDKLYAFSNVTKSASIRFRELSWVSKTFRKRRRIRTYALPSNIAAAVITRFETRNVTRGGMGKKSRLNASVDALNDAFSVATKNARV